MITSMSRKILTALALVACRAGGLFVAFYTGALVTLSFRLTVAAKLLFFSVLMFGFGYAMVPLYEKICAVTGINNLLNPLIRGRYHPRSRAKRAGGVRHQLAHTGFHDPESAANESDNAGRILQRHLYHQKLERSAFGGASRAVLRPAARRQMVQKIQCFCFDKLTLEKDETRQSPVVFVIDGKLPKTSTALPCHTPFLKWKALNEVVFSRPQCGAVGVFWRPRQKKRR